MRALVLFTRLAAVICRGSLVRHTVELTSASLSTYSDEEDLSTKTDPQRKSSEFVFTWICLLNRRL